MYIHKLRHHKIRPRLYWQTYRVEKQRRKYKNVRRKISESPLCNMVYDLLNVWCLSASPRPNTHVVGKCFLSRFFFSRFPLHYFILIQNSIPVTQWRVCNVACDILWEITGLQHWFGVAATSTSLNEMIDR